MDTLIATLVTALTAPISFLASTGLMLLAFAAIWLAFAVASVRDPARIEAAWRRLRGLPLPVEALAWLLLLPVVAGLWVWRRGWPLAGRATLVVGLAAWNLLVLLPA